MHSSIKDIPVGNNTYLIDKCYVLYWYTFFKATQTTQQSVWARTYWMTKCTKISFYLMKDAHKNYYSHYYYLVTCLINFHILIQRGHYFVVGAELVQEFAKVAYSSLYSQKAGENYAYFLSSIEFPWIGQTLIPSVPLRDSCFPML